MDTDLHFSSKIPDWLTPPDIIDRVLRTFDGTIDLDPCAEPPREDAETYHVPASMHFEQDDDGLSEAWWGRVYCNPPYGRKIGKWARKMRVSAEVGEIYEGILLVPARTDTAWFKNLWEADALCFWSGRLRFSGSASGAPFPSVLAYWGGHRRTFESCFGDAGKIIRP